MCEYMYTWYVCPRPRTFILSGLQGIDLVAFVQYQENFIECSNIQPKTCFPNVFFFEVLMYVYIGNFI